MEHRGEKGSDQEHVCIFCKTVTIDTVHDTVLWLLHKDFWKKSRRVQIPLESSVRRRNPSPGKLV